MVAVVVAVVVVVAVGVVVAVAVGVNNMNEWVQYKLSELRKWSDEQHTRPLQSSLTMPLTFNEMYRDRYPQYRERYLTYEQDLDPAIRGSLAWRIVQNRQYVYAGTPGKSKCMPPVWHGRHMGFNDIGG